MFSPLDTYSGDPDSLTLFPGISHWDTSSVGKQQGPHSGTLFSGGCPLQRPEHSYPWKASLTVAGTGFSVYKWQPLILIRVWQVVFCRSDLRISGSRALRTSSPSASAEVASRAVSPFIVRSVPSSQPYWSGLFSRLLLKRLLALAIFQTQNTPCLGSEHIRRTSSAPEESSQGLRKVQEISAIQNTSQTSQF